MDEQLGRLRCHSRSRALTLVLLASGVVCVSCVPTPPKPPSLSHYRYKTDGDDLATIHLATVLVWPWDNVSRAIQPTFSLAVTTPNSPIAITSEAQSQYSDSGTLSFSAQYGLGAKSGSPPSAPNAGRNLSQSNGDNKGSGAPDENGNSGDKSKSNDQKGGADASTKSKQTADRASKPNSDKTSEKTDEATGKSKTANSPISISDAITQLQMENALYQEAGLLNNFTSGLIQRRDYIPYIIRMQLTVLPIHRQEPYDLFLKLRLSLHSSDKQGFVHAASALANPLIVIPLLVTDSIEESQQTVSISAVSQIQAAMGAGIGPAALSADYGHVIDSINSSLSNRPNSLFSIGKMDDTTMMVRVGANRFGNDFELEPRTHSISFVVLLNRKLFSKDSDELAQEISVDATPTFRDALFDDPKSKGDIGGHPVSDSFVLESIPAIPATSNAAGSQPAGEIWCPPPQTVVVLTDETTAQATISGVRDWGNRAVSGTLIGFLSDKENDDVGYTSAFAYRDPTGVISLHFGPVTHAATKRPIQKWELNILVDKLRTDASFPRGNPWLECPNMPAVLAAAPNKNAVAGAGNPNTLDKVQKPAVSKVNKDDKGNSKQETVDAQKKAESTH